MTGRPTVTQYGTELSVFARATDGQIYKDTWNGSSWGGFSSLGGNGAGDPFAIVYNASGYSEIDVFAIGGDGNLLKDTWNGSSWGGFGSLGR